jgi:hypothetical protein
MQSVIHPAGGRLTGVWSHVVVIHLRKGPGFPLGEGLFEAVFVPELKIRSSATRARPGPGEIWLAVTKHDGVQLDSLLIDQAKFGQALRQVRASNFDLPVALGLQLADRALKIILYTEEGLASAQRPWRDATAVHREQRRPTTARKARIGRGTARTRSAETAGHSALHPATRLGPRTGRIDALNSSTNLAVSLSISAARNHLVRSCLEFVPKISVRV